VEDGAAVELSRKRSWGIQAKGGGTRRPFWDEVNLGSRWAAGGGDGTNLRGKNSLFCHLLQRSGLLRSTLISSKRAEKRKKRGP